MSAGLELRRRGDAPSAAVPPDPLPLARRRAAPPRRVAAWRRKLTIALGLLWLLDAALQLQPYMFTTDFPNQLIKPVGQGSPT